MTQRSYPIEQLMRWPKDQWKSILKHCKAEGITPTAYIRAAVARDLVLSRRNK